AAGAFHRLVVGTDVLPGRRWIAARGDAPFPAATSTSVGRAVDAAAVVVSARLPFAGTGCAAAGLRRGAGRIDPASAASGHPSPAGGAAAGAGAPPRPGAPVAADIAPARWNGRSACERSDGDEER